VTDAVTDAGAGGTTSLSVDGLGVLPGTASGPTVRGASAHLMVRPEDTRVVPAGTGFLVGRVLQTQFFGGISTTAVQVAGHERPVLVSQPGAAHLDRDSEVEVSWDAGKAVLLTEPQPPTG
jgi:ABC-type Fe3+/spermidine/putrescine transport system ATPase subunit